MLKTPSHGISMAKQALQDSTAVEIARLFACLTIDHPKTKNR